MFNIIALQLSKDFFVASRIQSNVLFLLGAYPIIPLLIGTALLKITNH
jgi:hypothetical protein